MPLTEPKYTEARLVPVRYRTETVISSCPGLEDVLLWRVLGDIKEGFYVDVGAGDPNAGSLTRWFYVNGWTGVNIEPHPELFGILDQWRPRDENLNYGVSNVKGTLTFYQVRPNALRQGWGLSSFDKTFGDAAVAMGYEVDELQVPTLTLDAIFENYCTGREIDLLKIDVEGYEAAVIRSSEWRRFRPKVLCIEATYPLSRNPSFASWEDDLLSSEYDFALFDGVNNYYVRRESRELLSQFNCGLNSGDPWRPAVSADYREPWIYPDPG